MIYYYLATNINIFRYLTFRSGCAMLTALVLAFCIAPKFIKYLKTLNPEGQPIRSDGPERHLKDKKGTPTMGGIIILLPTIVSTLLWADLSNPYVWITLFVLSSTSILGFADDYMKVTRHSSKGVPGKLKLLIQAAIGMTACFAIQKYIPAEYGTTLVFPFFKNLVIDLKFLYVFFVIIVIVGSSNAVNLTDGLDGLAIVPIIIVTACFTIISYLVGNYIFANYLQMYFISGAGELAVFCCAVIGASLTFLWYNVNPARIFMGDTGSLSLGAAIGVIAVIVKHEIILAIVGGLFVIEAVSVILQVYYFKITGGKRLFLMAPIHHHFEKKGWTESQVVIRFWIISVIFALIGISTLKLR